MPTQRPVFQTVRRGGKPKILRNTFDEVMNLPVKEPCKAVSNETNYIYNFVRATPVPTRNKAIGSRWIYKIKADIVVLEWERVPRCRLRPHVCSGPQDSGHPHDTGNSGRKRFGALAAGLPHDVSACRAWAGNVYKITPGHGKFDGATNHGSSAIDRGSRAPDRSNPHERSCTFPTTMRKLGFGAHFGSVSFYIDSISTLHRIQDLQLASQACNSMILLHPGTGQGGGDQHSLQQVRGPTC